MVVAVVVEKAVKNVFLEVAMEKVMGGNMVEVEAMAKKVVKAKHHIYNTSYSRACNLCNKTGHFSSNCPHAKEFAKMLAKRENINPKGFLPKR